MTLTRRDFCRISIATTAIAAGGLPAWAAADDKVKAAIMAFTGGETPVEGSVELSTPEIAENGNTVPVTVMADGASDVLVLASGNPNPDVATFHYGSLAAAVASTRIRLAETQDVIAVGKMRDGGFQMAARTVKVTIGGCGG